MVKLLSEMFVGWHEVVYRIDNFFIRQAGPSRGISSMFCLKKPIIDTVYVSSSDENYFVQK